MKVCLVGDADCVRGQIRRELCDRHYSWLRRFGTTLRPQQQPRKTMAGGRLVVGGRNTDRMYRECRAGREPAESLPTYAREWLVHELWTNGWTDAEIAAWTRMTTYTTARIRERLGLAVNMIIKGVA